MAGQIIANAEKIIALNDGLTESSSQINAVLDDYDELIQSTKRKITNALEEWKKRQAQAYERFLSAQEALNKAEEIANNSANEYVPSEYYQAVNACQAEYLEISVINSAIERIDEEFSSVVSSYRESIAMLRQDYDSISKKSSYILFQYSELIRKSTAEISAGLYGEKSESTIGRTEGGDSLSSNLASRNNLGNKSFELSETKQSWIVESDGSLVFNTPIETGEKLDSCQGKVSGFEGTCGLVACVNVLRLAGYPATESEVVGYASTTKAGIGGKTLCHVGPYPEGNGGTTNVERQQILQHFGIKSELREASVDGIAEAVAEGRGVIISVYAGVLYNGWTNYRDPHAITVTSVKKDRFGNIIGFYVCDSGTGGVDNSRFYTSLQIESALTGRQMNVTSIIR